jgi:hypothetical protein
MPLHTKLPPGLDEVDVVIAGGKLQACFAPCIQQNPEREILLS